MGSAILLDDRKEKSPGGLSTKDRIPLDFLVLSSKTAECK